VRSDKGLLYRVPSSLCIIHRCIIHRAHNRDAPRRQRSGLKRLSQ
jgi:hypothetical protein